MPFKRYNAKKTGFLLSILFCFGVFALSGCATKEKVSPARQLNASTDEEGTNYDAEITAIVKAIDTEKQQITFLNTERYTEQVLDYTEGTEFSNKYGKVVTLSQIELGEIVDVGYRSSASKAVKVSVNKDAWEYDMVGRLSIDSTAQDMKFSGKKFRYDEHLVVTDGQREITVSEINKQDELRIKGVDKTVMSVLVTTGHGYIKLQDYKDFVGGTIEVSRDLILPVVENMMIVAREGFYNVQLNNGNLHAVKTIRVYRDKETALSLSDVKLDMPDVGNVTFQIEPYGADLYINGAITDYSEPVPLNYGKHKIVVKMTGYDTYSGFLDVQDAAPIIRISLVDKIAEVTDDESSSVSDKNTKATPTPSAVPSSSPSASPAPGATASPAADKDFTKVEKDDEADDTEDISYDTAHKITIAAPEGVEIYIDNVYQGLSPCSFMKRLGNFTITLSKTGYTTRSYTVDIADDSKDVSLSFAELVKAE